MATKKFLDLTGLSYYDGKIKAVAGGSLKIDGLQIALKNVTGSEQALSTITIPTASASVAGAMSASDFTKLAGISAEAKKVTASTTNGNIVIDGVETVVFTPADASASNAGYMSASDFTKLAGIEAGAKANVIEVVKVNGASLTPDENKAVNVDLSAYALKSDLSSVYKYKGSVDNFSDLPSEGLTAGDVYNVVNADQTHGVEAGANVAWTGTEWDSLGGSFVVDAIENSEIDALFA